MQGQEKRGEERKGEKKRREMGVGGDRERENLRSQWFS
jgi:hypothetical protein